VGVYAGLRPLVSEASGPTAELSRAHAVRIAAPGLVTVAGGKYTTYRVMAKDAIDAVGRELREPIDESPTDELPLVGARGLATARVRAERHAVASRLPVGAVDRLLGRHGSDALALLDGMLARPELAEPVPGAERYLLAEVVHAVVEEGATHIDDVLTRRTRISIETPDRGRAAAERVVDVMAAELGWSKATARAELSHYRARVDAEQAAENMPDDDGADAVRSRVRDPRVTVGHTGGESF
jgi:glycerol-3-phosphate dehydrogenase